MAVNDEPVVVTEVTLVPLTPLVPKAPIKTLNVSLTGKFVAEIVTEESFTTAVIEKRGYPLMVVGAGVLVTTGVLVGVGVTVLVVEGVVAV